MPMIYRLPSSTRWSITLPADVSAQIDSIAQQRCTPANQVIVDLLREAMAAYDKRRAAFLALADNFKKSTDPIETKELREELLKMTFRE
jgi:metal-responsive CopG/Arc/MetJ family transcriptional regulator